jgi:DNA topoisomerase-2
MKIKKITKTILTSPKTFYDITVENTHNFLITRGNVVTHNSSLSGAIIGMAQSFKNSLPLLEEIGQFGSLRSPEAGAARYISTKTTNNFRLLYKDFELLDSQYEEGVQIEPTYFLPIIPAVLLNGSSGIAVGFATNILNRNPLDLVEACLNVLNRKGVPQLLPWWKDFSGEVRETGNTNQYLMTGSYRIVNTTTVEITELPPSITYQKYEAHLNSLLEKGTLYAYDDNCSGGISYTLKFSRSTLADLIKRGRLETLLKMQETETENLTCLDENGKLKLFESVTDLVQYFVNFRLRYYDKRKQYLIDKISKELTVLSNRAKFIKHIIEGKLVISNRPKSEIISNLEKLKFDQVNESYSYLLSMAISSLTKEVYKQLIREVADKSNELIKVKESDPIDMYKTDLIDLKKNLKATK